VKKARIVGAASSGPAAIHNAVVSPRLLVRAGIAALCVAGVLAGAVTYRSEKAADDARAAYLESRPRQDVVDRYEDSRPLNPDVEREVGQATALLELGEGARAEELIRDAARREPDNARIWAFWATLALALDKPADARRHWARARALNPRLPAEVPEPR
jgi:Flp pilus assembly protein TadD